MKGYPDVSQENTGEKVYLERKIKFDLKKLI